MEKQIQEIIELTAELRKKVQEIPRSQTTNEQISQIMNVEHSILWFQRNVLVMAYTFDIEMIWFPK